MRDRTFSAVNPPYVRRIQYGVAGGGPIIKDKTFFYASWGASSACGKVVRLQLPLSRCPRCLEMWHPGRSRGFLSPLPRHKPDGRMPCCRGLSRNWAFSFYDPYTTGPGGNLPRQPYLGNIIPANEISPAALALYQKLYPLPNAGRHREWHSDNYVVSPSQPAATRRPDRGAWRSEHQQHDPPVWPVYLLWVD